MQEIRRKPGFLPDATWLIARQINRFRGLEETSLHPLNGVEQFKAFLIVRESAQFRILGSCLLNEVAGWEAS